VTPNPCPITKKPVSTCAFVSEDFVSPKSQQFGLDQIKASGLQFIVEQKNPSHPQSECQGFFLPLPKRMRMPKHQYKTTKMSDESHAVYYMSLVLYPASLNVMPANEI